MSDLFLSGHIEAEGRGAWINGASTNSIKHLVVSRFCPLGIEQHNLRLSKLNKETSPMSVITLDRNVIRSRVLSKENHTLA